MRIKPALRAQNLKSSAVFDLLQKAKELSKQGRDIVSLSVGEPVWGTFERVRKAGIRAIEEGWTKYTPSAGIPALREAVARRMSRRFPFPVRAEEIAAAAGCKQALFAIFQCFFERGDEVILPVPYWVSYKELIELSGARPRLVPCEESAGFKLTPEGLRAGLRASSPEEARPEGPQPVAGLRGGAKGLLLNTPNNPTGAVYTKEELAALGAVLKERPDLLVITDDIYDRLVFEGESAPHLLEVCPDLKDRTLCVNGASKAFLMTGWRIAWLTAPAAHIKVFTAFQSQSVSCVNSIAQKALADELLNCDEEIRALVQKLKPLRQKLLAALDRLPGVKPFPPAGAFYLWAGVKDVIGRSYKGKKILSSADLMERLLSEADLICVSGENFGLPGYLRFSYAVEPEVLEKAVSRLSAFFSHIK